MIPDEPWLWLSLAVVIALTIGLAVWKRVDVNIKSRHGDRLSLTRRPSETRSHRVSVARGVKLDEAEVGDIAGFKTPHDIVRQSENEDIDILSGGTVKKSKTGDIVGYKTTPDKT